HVLRMHAVGRMEAHGALECGGERRIHGTNLLIHRRRSHGCSAVVLVASALALSACNTVTGADDLRFGRPAEASERTKGGGGGGGADGAGGRVGAGGTGEAGTGGTSGTAPHDVALPDAVGVKITEIAFDQAVKRTIMKDGAPSASGVPLIAGRGAL